MMGTGGVWCFDTYSFHSSQGDWRSNEGLQEACTKRNQANESADAIGFSAYFLFSLPKTCHPSHPFLRR
jgi:hypothetical protein